MFLLVTTSSLGASQAVVGLGDDLKDWQVRLELARVLSYQKRYDESIREYKTVLAQQPQLTDAVAELAAVYAYNGQPEESLTLLKPLLEGPMDEARTGQMAHVLATIKQYDLSEKLYQQYLTAHPDDLKMRLKYAEMLSWKKDYARSLEEFEKLISERPDDQQLRRKYALVLVWSGQTEKAAEELRKTLTTDAK